MRKFGLKNYTLVILFFILPLPLIAQKNQMSFSYLPISGVHLLLDMRETHRLKLRILINLQVRRLVSRIAYRLFLNVLLIAEPSSRVATQHLRGCL